MARTRHLRFAAAGSRPDDPRPRTGSRGADDRASGKFASTRAEAAFTLEILKGDGRVAAAAGSGITLSTARTHLTRISGKVGVRRQAALVRLLEHSLKSGKRFSD